MCIREKVGLLAYSVLSMGVLSGKYLDGAKPEGARFTLSNRNSPRYNPPSAQEAVRKYVAIAQKHSLDPSAMAIAYALAKPFMTSVIIGATTIEQLKTNIEAVDLVLPAEVLQEIEEVYKEIPDPTV